MPVSPKRKMEKVELTPNQKINRLFEKLFGATDYGTCRSHTDPQYGELYGWVRVDPALIKVLEEWNSEQGGEHNDYGVTELVRDAIERHCNLLARRENRKEKKAAEDAFWRAKQEQVKSEQAEIERVVKSLLADIGEEAKGDEPVR